MSLSRAPEGGLNRSSDLAFTKDGLASAAEKLLAKRGTKPDAEAFQRFLDQYRADAFVEDFLSLTVEDAAALAIELQVLDQHVYG